MKMPMFLLGTAVIFWGWQTGLWIIALPIAICLEAARWFPSRWDFSENDFRRIANFCLIILCGLLVYLLSVNRSIYFIYNLLKWLPVVFFPLLLVQAYSVKESLNISSLFLLLDNSTKKEPDNGFSANLNYPYFALCLLSASTGNTRDITFYAGMFLMSAFALFYGRTKRFSLITWVCLILIAGSVGFIGQIGLHQLHLAVSDYMGELLSNSSGQETDFLKKQTKMGEIGLLKQSNEIIFRVTPEAKKTPPRLLREATYNKYISSTWIALNPNFTVIQPESNGKTWHLGSQTENYSMINIFARLKRGQGLLRLADGTFEINELPVNKMEKNKYGTVKVEGKIDFLAYQAFFNNSLSLDSPPTEEDLEIPKSETLALNKIVSQLNIKGKSPSQILEVVDRFFQKNFSYSLNLAGKSNHLTPVSKFLLETRSGHCEYFATSTVLLLRSLGIPARYAVGYSVHEFNDLESQYIVRSRHAHAWTLAYLEGKWQAFDTTPPDWISVENKAVSQWGFVSDFWSLLSFKFWLFLRNNAGGDGWKYGGIVVVLVMVFVGWKFIFKNKVQRLKKNKMLKARNTKGLYEPISDFYLIEEELKKMGFFRPPSEPLKSWLKRLKKEQPELAFLEDLESLVELYYQIRFNSKNSVSIVQEKDDAEIKKLKSCIESWLKKYQKPVVNSN